MLAKIGNDRDDVTGEKLKGVRCSIPSTRPITVSMPAAIARAAHLRVDQRVRVSVEGDQVVITPMTDHHLSLEQRLAVYDPTRHGGEVFQSI